jgi:hypothetical protein
MWRPYIDVLARRAKQAIHILDRFHIAAKLNKAIFPTLSSLFQPASAPRPSTGIGPSAARSLANQFLTATMIPSGLVDSSWALSVGSRIVDGVVNMAGVRSGSRVREFRFGYRRQVQGYPLLDTLLEISVDSTGVVRGLGLSDVSAIVGATQNAVRSESQAQALFLAAAEARADNWNPTISAGVKRFRVGYVLPYNGESLSAPPVLHGEIIYRNGVVASPVEDATLSLVGASPQLSIMVPWIGDVSSLTSPNGTWCGRDSQCSSGHCFVFGECYGICGQCSTGSNCASGRCDPPNPGKTPVAPSACTSIAVPGSGCETSSDCGGTLTCENVISGALGSTLRTCSACSTDVNCASGSRCFTRLNWSANRAYKTCVASSSLSNGEMCSSGGSCISGRCATFSLPDGTSVGVCSECVAPSQCASGICAAPSFRFGTGLRAGQCG